MFPDYFPRRSIKHQHPGEGVHPMMAYTERLRPKKDLSQALGIRKGINIC